MSRSGKVHLQWADGRGAGPDGKHVFQLGIAQIEELQEICKAGPQRVFGRLSSDDWRLEDIRETLRLGLIGGGMDATKAATLISRYVTDGALLENIIPARAVIMAAMHTDVEEDARPKADGAKSEAEETPAMSDDSSTSPQSTASGPH